MSTIQANPSENGGGRAFKPGPRLAFAAAAVGALILAAALVLALKGGGAGGASGPARIVKPGVLPSWLPKSAREPVTHTGPTFEQATAAKPILYEEQGYTVHATVPTGSADITAVGPSVPSYVSNYAQRGLWPASRMVPSTFFVTFADVKGSIPIAARAFTVLTDNGKLVHARISAQVGQKVPTVVHAGQHITLLVTSKTIEGQGSLRWAPESPKVLVGWLYQLELD
jgi:hypothetical protein